MENNSELLLANLLKQNALTQFFEKRLALILDNKYPIQLSSESSRYIMHLIPVNQKKYHLDLSQLEQVDNYFLPHGETEKNEYVVPDINFDGIMYSASLHEKRGYTQVFRDARIETVIVPGKYDPQMGTILSLYKIQHNTNFRLSQYLRILKKFSITGPYEVFFRMVGLENTRLDSADISKSGYDAKGRNKSIILHDFIFPSIIINDELDILEKLEPLFNIYWNMFGFPSAPDNSYT